MWKTAWQPSTPRRMASASERSPCTTSASRPDAFSGRRASTTTSSPRSRRRLTTRDPMNPVPPVTNALMARHRSSTLEAVDAAHNGSKRRAVQRALTIGVGPGETDLSELRELLRTAGVAVSGEMVQRREQPDPDRYFGRGKLVELKQAAKDADANLIAVDDELLPRQERNLEEELGMPVIDRTAIILDIFADHARSAEGKLQVELAQLEYNLARMRGLWTHLERLGAGRIDGGIGTRGPGESQIETDRRLSRNRISALRRRLRQSEKNRSVMRTRRDSSSLPRIALAGYTNAGKSTLLNALTGAEVEVRDRLFHTLDPTTRTFELSGRDALLTDMQAVDEVLEEIGAGEKPRLLVFNKIDLLSEEQRRETELDHPEAVLVSAQEGEGLDALRERIEAAFEETLTEVELLIPYSQGGRLHELHEVAGELERTEREDGVLVHAKVPSAELHRFSDLAVA